MLKSTLYYQEIYFLNAKSGLFIKEKYPGEDSHINNVKNVLSSFSLALLKFIIF